MESALDKAFAALDTVIRQYCREDKKQQALACTLWAAVYADAVPKKPDRDLVIGLIKKAGTDISAEGKPAYKHASEQVIRHFLALRRAQAAKPSKDSVGAGR